jgi:hypothetical protein
MTTLPPTVAGGASSTDGTQGLGAIRGTAAGLGSLALDLVVRKGDVWILVPIEQEVRQERDTVIARIETRDTCAFWLEEHVTGTEDRLRLTVDLQDRRAVEDASNDRAVVYVQPGSVARHYVDASELDVMGLLGLLQVCAQEHVAGYRLCWFRNVAGRHVRMLTGRQAAPFRARARHGGEVHIHQHP